MTVTLPNLPAIGIIHQMYLMAFLAFLACWIANKNAERVKKRNRSINDNGGDGSDASSTFWTFIAIASACTFVLSFFIGTVILIAKGVAP